MQHFTKAELKAIRKNINQGVVYCGIQHNRGIGQIFRTVSGNIGWQHYGQSAQPNTIEDLRFIIDVIFEDCDTITPAEWSDYHIGYIPIDKQYEGIDYSTSHPNVCGL